MYRLYVKRTWMQRPGFVRASYEELLRLASQPDCLVLPDAYNPPGFPGSLGTATAEHVEAYEAARRRAAEAAAMGAAA